MNRNEALGKILGSGLAPIVVDDRLPVEGCAEAVLRAGLEAMEISCRHPRALEMIARVKSRFPHLAVGAASLIEEGPYRDFLATKWPVPTIDQAADAGADFLVSLLPFRPPTYRRHAASRIIISGVMTPGEAHQALDWGANLVKFAGLQPLGGPAYLRGMDAATHRGFPFFVTGGMRPKVIGPYVEAHVLVFGAGFDIILGADLEAMSRRFQPQTLRQALVRYAAAIAEARAKYMPTVPFAGKDPAAIAAASGRHFNHDRP